MNRTSRRQVTANLTQGWTRRRILKAGAAAGIVAAGGSGFRLGSSATTTTSQDTPKNGGVLVAGWEEDAGTLDPSKQLCGHENRLAVQYGDTLWSLFGVSTDIKPALAETWKASEDGLTWDITLKPGLKFQDGSSCDAKAVKWSYDRWLDPNHPFHDPPYGLLTYYLGAIQGIEQVGDLSLRFTLSKQDSMFESNMLVRWSDVVSPTAVQALGKEGFGQKPVGTGAWQVAEWEKGVRIVLERNDLYWGQKTILDQLIIKPIVENAQRLNQLQTGEVDLIVAMSPEFIPAINGDPNLQLLQSPGMHIWWIALNMHEEPMKKKEVRQALNYAVNKDAIVTQILQGAARITPGPMLEQSWAHDPSVKPYPYDPKKAKELLAVAGYPEGFTTKFWVPESGSGMIAPKEIAQVVQDNLKDIGVNAEIVTQEWTSYVRDWGGEGFDRGGRPFYGMGEMSWNFATPDPGFWMNPNLRTDAQPPNAFNGSFYSNPLVDDLLTKASSTFDREERADYYRQAQKIMWDDCPWIFMFSADNIGAATNRLKGVALNPNPWILRLEGAYFEE